MMAKQLPPVPPPESSPASESNKFIAKYKTSLTKRWSLTKSEVLYEIAILAAYLWALDRPAEALGVAASIARDIPAPPPLPRDRVNYSLWCPATYSHSLVCRLGGQTMPDLVNASRAALLADAGVARDNPDHLRKTLEEVRERVLTPTDPKAMKYECEGLARGLCRMTFYSELAAAGDPLFAPFAADANALIPQLKSKLSARLRS